MKLILFFVLFVGCGDAKRTVYTDPPSNNGGGDDKLEKYARIEPILKTSCLTAGCHKGGAIVDLRSAEKLAASNSKARISGGSMPPTRSGPGKAFTAEKKSALLSFF